MGFPHLHLEVNDAFALAEAVAERTRSPIGPEHLFLGLLALEGSMGCRLLEAAGMSAEALREELEAAVPAGTRVPGSDVVSTRDARRAVDAGLAEMRVLGSWTFRTEHLLLGLLRGGQGLPAAVEARRDELLVMVREAAARWSEVVPAEALPGRGNELAAPADAGGTSG